VCEVSSFFFQAEDGIRDDLVTGVQTCALPISAVSADGHTLAIVVRNGDTSASHGFTFDLTALPTVGATAQALRTSKSENLVSLRSEERRVGKEGRWVRGGEGRVE